jgi:intron-binding protein aquarius
VVRSSLAPLAKRPEGRLFLQLLDQLRFYTRFEINDQTGEALSQTDMTALHYQRIAGQRSVLANLTKICILVLNIGSSCTILAAVPC